MLVDGDNFQAVAVGCAVGQTCVKVLVGSTGLRRALAGDWPGDALEAATAHHVALNVKRLHVVFAGSGPVKQDLRLIGQAVEAGEHDRRVLRRNADHKGQKAQVVGEIWPAGCVDARAQLIRFRQADRILTGECAQAFAGGGPTAGEVGGRIMPVQRQQRRVGLAAVGGRFDGGGAA